MCIDGWMDVWMDMFQNKEPPATRQRFYATLFVVMAPSKWMLGHDELALW